jgi:hypothetical protein
MKSFKRILSHSPALLGLIAIGFREWGQMINNTYEQKFFAVFKEQYNLYNSIMIPCVIIFGILANAASGLVVEAYGSKYDMTLPCICIFKTVGDFLTLFVIYTQVNSFAFSMFGNILQLALAKGWHAPATLIL